MSLIVIAPPTPSAAADLVWLDASADGRTLQAQGSAAAALLPGRGDVVLGLPAGQLSWHAAVLPPGSQNNAVRLRSVLGGMLEDRLLDEPDNLHFALEPGARADRSAGTVWVAACNRAWLRAVVQTLEGAGRRIARIVPECAPQPADAPAAWAATGEPGAAQLIVCDASGVALLPLDAAGLALAGALPEDATLVAEPGVGELADALFGGRLPLLTAAQRWLQAAQSPWDLAQFDLASTGRARAGKTAAALWQTIWRAPRWRPARWGALVLLATQLVGLNAWAWKERHALDAKRAAVRNVLTQTFPNVKLVVDAPLQMAREVAALQQSSGSVSPADLEPMLGALAASLPPDRVPGAIDYSAGQLRLRGLALQAADATSLTATLAARGYSARLEGDLLLVQALATR